MTQAQHTRLWNRDYSLLWLGLVQSYLGDAFLAIGLMWLALEITGSPLIAGTIVALEGAGKLIGPLAGVIVDRTSKRMLMISSDVLRGLILILLFVLQQTSLLEVWHLYGLVILLGALSIFYAPALQVMLPTLVPNNVLPAANSAIQGAAQVAMIVGASLAGLVLATLGTPFALLIDGISFFIAAIMLWFVHFPPVLLQSSKLGLREVGADLIGGLRYILSTPNVLILTGLAFFLNLVLSPVNVIFPIFSNTVLGAGVTGYGLLASSIAAGLFIGTLIVGVIGDRLPYTQSILVGLLGISSMLGGLSITQSLIPALVLTAGLGLMAPLIQVPLVSRLQRSTPRQYQGRVFATLGTLVTLALPLSAALAGQALVALSVGIVFRIAAAGTLIMVGVWVVVGIGLNQAKVRQSTSANLPD